MRTEEDILELLGKKDVTSMSALEDWPEPDLDLTKQLIDKGKIAVNMNGDLFLP